MIWDPLKEALQPHHNGSYDNLLFSSATVSEEDHENYNELDDPVEEKWDCQRFLKLSSTDFVKYIYIRVWNKTVDL